MKVAWVGTYDPEFSRNRKLRELLRIVGADLTEVNLPVWGGDRVGLVDQPKMRLALRVAVAYARLTTRLLFMSSVDVILVSYPGWFDMPIAVLAGRVRRTPVVFDLFISLYDTLVTDRRLVDPGSLLGRIARSIDTWSIRHADLVIADTAAHLEFYRSMARSHVVGAVVPLGADETVFNIELPREPQEGLVVFHGTFVPLQGLETIVEAAAALSGVARVTFIGDGQHRALAESIAASRALANVEFVGLVPLEEVAHRLRAASVALGIFGVSEKAGRVVPHKVYECLALGVPVISRTGDAAFSMFKSGEVALVPPGDPEALAAEIRRVLGDPSYAEDLSAAGRLSFESRFSDQALARALEGALRTAIQSNTHSLRT